MAPCRYPPVARKYAWTRKRASASGASEPKETLMGEKAGARGAEARGPLAGVRVVDLPSVVFGPYATQIMADMGAEVIKIEAPAGDNTRWISAGPVPGLGGV